MTSHQKSRQGYLNTSSYLTNRTHPTSSTDPTTQTHPISSTSHNFYNHESSSPRQTDFTQQLMSNEILQEEKSSSDSSFFGNIFQRVKTYFTSGRETNGEESSNGGALSSNPTSKGYMSSIFNNLKILVQYPKQKIEEYVANETEKWGNLTFEEREEIRNNEESFHLISSISHLLSRGITEMENDDLPERLPPSLLPSDSKLSSEEKSLPLSVKITDFFDQDIRDMLRRIEEEDLQKRFRIDVLHWSELTTLQRLRDQNDIESRYEVASLDEDLQTLIRETQERDQQNIREDILRWSELTTSQRSRSQNDIENKYNIVSLDEGLQILIRGVQEQDEQEKDNFPFEWRVTGNQSTCDDYNIGEEREVTGMNRYERYIIKRESENVYIAFLFLRFHPSRYYDNEKNIPRDQVHPRYLERVKSCIDQVNPQMLVPNGQRLRIVIEDDYEKDNRLVKNISIKAARGRSMSDSYASDVNCHTVTHEVLHLLGLPDEYEETMLGRYITVSTDERVFHPSYDCRSIQTNSIMAAHWERFGSVNRGYVDSLLDPAHFNAILYGNCLERDNMRLYSECSSLSYRTSNGNGGSTDCSAQKNYCQSQDVLARRLVGDTQNLAD